MRNVAIGTGVILICVTVSIVSAGAGAPVVSVILAAAAKEATTLAIKSGIMSGVVAGIATGYQTGDFDKAVKAAALAGSESFKWGAITGAIKGGAKKAISIHKASSAAKMIPTWQQSEQNIAKAVNGETQLSYLGGEQVPWGTPGATRPDVVFQEGGKTIALEVKNYALDNPQNVYSLRAELRRQISERIHNLPSGYEQRIALDVTGRNYPADLVNSVVSMLKESLDDIYHDIPIMLFGI